MRAVGADRPAGLLTPQAARLEEQAAEAQQCADLCLGFRHHGFAAPHARLRRRSPHPVPALSQARLREPRRQSMSGACGSLARSAPRCVESPVGVQPAQASGSRPRRCDSACSTWGRQGSSLAASTRESPAASSRPGSASGQAGGCADRQPVLPVLPEAKGPDVRPEPAASLRLCCSSYLHSALQRATG